MKMNKIDMSSKAIDLRIRRLSQLRKLCISLKLAGKKAGLHNVNAELKMKKEDIKL